MICVLAVNRLINRKCFLIQTYPNKLKKSFFNPIQDGSFRDCSRIREAPCAFLLVEAIVFIDFVVFKDQLIAISGYLYTPCADQGY